MAALASLTEMYSDSDGEDGIHKNEQLDGTDSADEHSDASVKTSAVVGAQAQESKWFLGNETVKAPQPVNRPSNLVSYLNDTAISDDEGERDHVLPEPMEEGTPEPLSPPNSDDSSTAQDKVSPLSSIELPPEPAGKCSNEMQQKIGALNEKMKIKGHDMNLSIQERKSFRNPSIYEKLIQYCGINEFGTNYSPHVYDPFKWNKNSYYDELAKVQKTEMDKREKERKEKPKVEFIMGSAKKPSNGATVNSITEDDRKRKSKWDQVGVPGAVLTGLRPSAPAGLVTLTSSSTGTKSTIISAFGSLPKKPKT